MKALYVNATRNRDQIIKQNQNQLLIFYNYEN